MCFSLSGASHHELLHILKQYADGIPTETHQGPCQPAHQQVTNAHTERVLNPPKHRGKGRPKGSCSHQTHNAPAVVSRSISMQGSGGETYEQDEEGLNTPAFPMSNNGTEEQAESEALPPAPCPRQPLSAIYMNTVDPVACSQTSLKMHGRPHVGPGQKCRNIETCGACGEIGHMATNKK